jgi:hypothetical protein
LPAVPAAALALAAAAGAGTGAGVGVGVIGTPPMLGTTGTSSTTSGHTQMKSCRQRQAVRKEWVQLNNSSAVAACQRRSRSQWQPQPQPALRQQQPAAASTHSSFDRHARMQADPPLPVPSPRAHLAVAVGGGIVAHQLVALCGLHRLQLLTAGSGASSSSTACECAASKAKSHLIGGMPAEQDNAGRMVATQQRLRAACSARARLCTKLTPPAACPLTGRSGP